jgi:hypothetical protein
MADPTDPRLAAALRRLDRGIVPFLDQIAPILDRIERTVPADLKRARVVNPLAEAVMAIYSGVGRSDEARLDAVHYLLDWLGAHPVAKQRRRLLLGALRRDGVPAARRAPRPTRTPGGVPGSGAGDGARRRRRGGLQAAGRAPARAPVQAGDGGLGRSAGSAGEAGEPRDVARRVRGLSTSRARGRRRSRPPARPRDGPAAPGRRPAVPTGADRGRPDGEGALGRGDRPPAPHHRAHRARLATPDHAEAENARHHPELAAVAPSKRKHPPAL